MQQALFSAENKQACHRRDGIPQSRCDCRSADPHIKNSDKHIIKHHVQHPARHGTYKRKGGFLAGDHVQGKVIHQQDRHGKQQIPAQVFHAVSRHIRRQIHARKDPSHEQITQTAHHNSDNHIYQNQKGKVLLRLLPLLLPHFLHNDRTASCCQHGGNGCDKLDDRRCQVDCRQCVRADQIGHKQTVNHGVERHEYTHGYGRNCEF